MTLIVPSSQSKILLGLISLCITPTLCACPMAFKICFPIAIVSVTENLPFSRIHSEIVLACTYSIIINSPKLVSRRACTPTIFVFSNFAKALASVLNRLRKLSSLARKGSIIFKATIFSRFISIALKTTPIPPLPMTSRIL